jgi:hypothetical protein
MHYARMLLAVPFVGKDTPSRASDFAHSEVQIGLSVLAYRYEGLRERDMRALITALKQSMAAEPGAYKDRPSRILFGEWVAEAK